MSLLATFQQTWPRRLALGLALAALLAGPVHAADDLRQELAEAARGVAKLLADRGESAIALGQFTGPANFPTSAGPGIAMVLAEELQKQGIAVKQRATLGVKGEYLVSEVQDPDDVTAKYLAVRVKGRVEDAFGNVLGKFGFERTVPGEEAVVALMGTPVELPSAETPAARDRRLRQSLEKPQTALSGARVAAGPHSPYAVEILVDDKPRPARDDDGLAFVKIEKTETYAVRLINDSDTEAAVRLTVDGLSLFAFSEHRRQEGPHKGEPLYSVVLIPPHKSLVVKGWHRTNEVSDAFVVTDYPKSAAALARLKGNLGTITATFAAAWPEDADPPKDEAPAKRGSPGATGYGPGVEAKFDVVKRRIGVIRAAVSVRYTK
jgi:hypothetical protein